MNPLARQRLFGYDRAFDDPATLAVTAAVVGLLVLTPLALAAFRRLGKVGPEQARELWLRYRSWLVIVPLILGPILLGAAWTILGIGALGLLGYREYARATGLFRERSISLVVAAGIALLTLAALDNWYRLFVALTPLTVGAILIAAILADRPNGYIQRTALGILGFALFGTCLGHLGYLANDPGYRPWLILVFLAVELNDIFAYIAGKTLDGPKLAPRTSPNKTVGGSLGAVVATTLLVVAVGVPVFRGTAIGNPLHLAVLGLVISVVGQLGDLMVSSLKRDLGIKDMGALIPGHGGILDRFDSLILVAPAAFHYINYFVGVGATQPTRIFTTWG